MKRIMYVEYKSDGLAGQGRIGWVELTRSTRSYRYKGKLLLKTKSGYKYNCVDAETGERYWVSGARRDGADRLYGGVVEVDADARQTYWADIRRRPEHVDLERFSSQRAAKTG